MNRGTPPKLKQFAAAKQRRMDELLEKNSAGTITPNEKSRLETLVTEAENLMVANAQLLADFADQSRSTPPTSAVPVTIWVSAQPAGQ